jgi:hypothetical protein
MSRSRCDYWHGARRCDVRVCRGSGDDRGKSIAVDSLGNADVTGETSSDQTSFPVAIGPDLTYNGAVDAFVAKINAGGTSLVDAGYIGGLNPDRA